MKKILIMLCCFGAILALNGCVSARETQNPQPRKAVICKNWEVPDESQAGDQKELRKNGKESRSGKNGKENRKKSGNRRNK